METQYSAYNLHVPNVTVSGASTLGENIADNGGLKCSHLAYTRWRESKKDSRQEEELSLPGIPLNHEQLFFLSFSQVWCSKSTPQAQRQQVSQ